MWGDKKKAITFSFDDGVSQDVRLIELLDKYNLKATFNLNSARLGLSATMEISGVTVSHNKVKPNEIKEIYKNHEVAAHTLSHPDLTALDEETIIYQVERDRVALSELCGYEVVGMAYPGGGVNSDDRVANIIKNHTGIKYARTITSTYSFEKQNNFFRFNPTVYWIEAKKMFGLADRFLNDSSSDDQLLYICGHSYELDAKPLNWELFEDFCKIIANQSNVFYGTNKQVLLR